MLSEAQIKVGQEFPLTIKKMGINGEGIGYFKRTIIFVKGALTDEEVVVKVTKTAPKYSEAVVRKIRKPSPNRVVAPCPVYEACGGCQLQHVSYSAQLQFKKDILIQALKKHTTFNTDKMKIRDTIGMEDPFRYRNKSQFQARTNQDGAIVTGLFGADSHELVPTSDCLVQDERTVEITNSVRDLLTKYGISAYDEATGRGFIRTIVVRVGVETDEVQLVFVTTSEKFTKKQEILTEIKARHPEIVSIMQNINSDKTSLIFGDKTLLLDGKASIEEALKELHFDLSARAFFQLNPKQTNRLYEEVSEALTLTGDEKIVDAYCGVGTIGLSLAKKVQEVRGMDVVREAVLDAQNNAVKNGITNAHYVTGTAEEVFQNWRSEGYAPDAIIVDPPRTGLDASLTQAILSARPKQLVYVSCNPSTLARDLALFEKRYRIRYLQPVDMFPMTSHVECVVKLSLKSNQKKKVKS